MIEGMDLRDILRAEAFNEYNWCPDKRGGRERHRQLQLVHVADNEDGHKPLCLPVKDIAQDIDPETLGELLP